MAYQGTGVPVRVVGSALRASGGRRHVRWLLVVYAGCLALLGPSVVPEPPRPDGVTADRLTADRLTAMFHQYGQTSGRWSGADRTASVRLPDGRLLWLFSDTFLGPVAADGSRPRTAPFVNNSAVIQRGDELTETVHGGSVAVPAALVPTDRSDHFHWIGDAQVVGESLQILVNRYRRTGSGPLDHALLGTALAVFDLPGLTPAGVSPLPLGTRVSWGSELLTGDGYTYVYGTEAAGQLKFAHVARVAGGDLAGTWQFWTGAGWSPTESASTRLFSGVGTSYGVQRIGDRYVLVTHENNVVFSSDLVAYTASAPTGPFRGPEHLLRAPETADGHLVYDADLHPDLARPGRLLVSYNVNNVDDAVTYADTRIYRPRFREVEWPRRHGRAATPPAPTGLTAVPAGAGRAELRWQAPRTDEKVTYQVHCRDVTAGQTHFARLGGAVGVARYSADLLVDGHDYEFRVTALGDQGESPPSPAVRFTATVPPAVPTGLKATAQGDGTVRLAWDPVGPLVSYRVYHRDVTQGEQSFGRPTLPDSRTSFTTVALQHDHEYEFAVAAATVGGESPLSAPVRIRVRVAPPAAAPTGLRASPGPGRVELTWQSPNPDGWHRVFRRDLTAGEREFRPDEVPVRGNRAVVGLLQGGHEYEFVVAELNPGGVGPVSTSVRATPTPSVLPGPTGSAAAGG